MEDKGDRTAGTEVSTENSPLKRAELNIENETNAPSGLRRWLASSIVKWGIAISVIIVLSTVALVTTFLLLDTSIKLLKLWPRSKEPENLIHYTHGSSREWDHLTDQLDELFYHYLRKTMYVVECKDGVKLKELEVCDFDTGSVMRECSKSNNYGYDIGRPCIFLQFNQIADWVPEPYTAQEVEKYVKINRSSAAGDLVYLDCQGDTPADKENMGIIQYTPFQGFQTKYFPYIDDEDYMSPLVGIRFVRPTTGVLISVSCKLWAKNVKHADGIPVDQISFYLLVD